MAPKSEEQLAKRTHVPIGLSIEEQLKKFFADTLNKSISKSAVMVHYVDEKGQKRVEIGFPYELSEEHLIIGPYAKSVSTSPPKDYHESKRKIPIEQIIEFYKISANLERSKKTRLTE